MKSIRALIPFGIFLVLGAAYLYASPYVALFFLSSALRQDDAKAVESFLDVPTLRESLRSQIREYIEYSSKADGFNSGWTELAKGIGGSLSESCVVSATSADGIARVFRTGKLDLCDPSPADSEPAETGFSGANLKYLSFDRFAVGFPSDGGSQLQGFELTRRNLFDWKITSARFDLTAIGESGTSSASKIACGKQIARVEQSILSDEKIPIANIRKTSINSPFSERPSAFSFTLGGKDGYVSYDSPGGEKIWTFVNSSIVGDYSRKIIEACPDVANVHFGVYATDGGGSDWYYTRQGIIEGQCVPLGQSLPGWGWGYC